jgi:hypothetical protein
MLVWVANKRNGRPLSVQGDPKRGLSAINICVCQDTFRFSPTTRTYAMSSWCQSQRLLFQLHIL